MQSSWGASAATLHSVADVVGLDVTSLKSILETEGDGWLQPLSMLHFTLDKQKEEITWQSTMKGELRW